MNSIYLIGSLRNPRVPEVANHIRAYGYNVHDDWFSAGPEADDYWQKYSKGRGQSFRDALNARAANNTFRFDQQNLVRCDAAVLVLPAGKSGHLEFGYTIGLGKCGYILLDDVDRWDVMYRFATDVCEDVDQLVHCLRKN